MTKPVRRTLYLKEGGQSQIRDRHALIHRSRRQFLAICDDI